MSITHRNDDPVVQLDLEQRIALRSSVALASSGTDDIARNIERGRREDAVTAIENLRGMVALLDAIGWSEHPDAPHVQSVDVSPRAAWWATEDRRAIMHSLADAGDNLDGDLLAIGAYDQIIASAAGRVEREEVGA